MADLADEKLIHLFTTPVLKYVWPDSDELNAELGKPILAHKRKSEGTAYSAIGGWQSNEDFQTWSGEPGRIIMQRVADLVRHASREIYTTYRGEERNQWTISLWANVNRKGHYNKNHVHAGATWSGVYIVDSGNSGSEPFNSGMLALINPNLAATMSFYRNAIPMRYSIHPEPGLMLVWPGYLMHMVHPHLGRRARVSISFNIRKDPYP